MALIQFEDLPSTNTPITANNLNNNFNELNNTLQNFKGNTYNNVDLNDFQAVGIYYMGIGLTNAPTAGYGYMFVMNNGGPDASQLYIDVATGNTYIRTRITSLGIATWSAWKQLAIVS